jgi:microcystin-dependent protein
MSDIRLHNKLHNANHHTLSSVGVIDSGEDPIASKDYPFIGDFYLNGGLSASNGLSAKGSSYFINSGTNPTISIVNSTSATGITITKSGSGNAITCNNAISSSSVIYASGGNSNQWNEASIDILTNADNWTNSYTTLTSNSSNWNLGFSLVSQLTGVSSTWNSAYNTVQSNSGKWESVYTTVDSNSSFWKSLYDTAPLWNAMHSTISANSGNWNSTYTTVSNTSSNWEATTNTVSSNSAFWESTYSTVSSNSGFWKSNYTTVNSKSGNWESAYTTLCANSATWATPVGTVMTFAMSSAPIGWLKCNGQNVSITAYQNLYNILSTTFNDISTPSGEFKLPDLRGIFIRGWVDDKADTTNKNVGFGLDLGELQQDQFQGHWHLFTKRSDNASPSDNNGFDMYGTEGRYNISFALDETSPHSPKRMINNGFGTPRKGFETRPINMSLLYCIKY